MLHSLVGLGNALYLASTTPPNVIKILLSLGFLLPAVLLHAGNPRTYQVQSPNGAIIVKVIVDEHIRWSVDHKGRPVIVPSGISLQLEEVKGSRPDAAVSDDQPAGDHRLWQVKGSGRTWPDVICFEGVKGLENFKWANEDQPCYVVTIPWLALARRKGDTWFVGALTNRTPAVGGEDYAGSR